MLRLALALLAALPAAGCQKNDTVSCREAAEAFVALTRAELEREGRAEASEQADVGLPALEAQLIESCEEQAWSEAMRTCVAEAQGPGALERCDRFLRAGDAGPAAPEG